MCVCVELFILLKIGRIYETRDMSSVRAGIVFEVIFYYYYFSVVILEKKNWVVKDTVTSNDLAFASSKFYLYIYLSLFHLVFHLNRRCLPFRIQSKGLTSV